MFEDYATFGWMTKTFTNKNMADNHLKYTLSTQADAIKIENYTIADSSLIVDKVFDLNTSEHFSTVMSELLSSINFIEGKIDLPIISVLYQSTLTYSNVANYSMDELSRALIKTSVSGYSQLIDFRNLDPPRSVASVVQKISKSKIGQVNNIYQPPLLWSNQQIWLLSFRKVLMGYTGKEPTQDVQNFALFAVDGLRSNTLGTICNHYDISKDEIYEQNLMFVYDDLFGLNVNQFLTVTRRLAEDILLFRKCSYLDANTMIGLRPASKILETSLRYIETQLISIRDYADVLLTVISDFFPTSFNSEKSLHDVPEHMTNSSMSIMEHIKRSRMSSLPVDFSNVTTQILYTNKGNPSEQGYFEATLTKMPMKDVAGRIGMTYEMMIEMKLLHVLQKLKEGW